MIFMVRVRTCVLIFSIFCLGSNRCFANTMNILDSAEAATIAGGGWTYCQSSDGCWKQINECPNSQEHGIHCETVCEHPYQNWYCGFYPWWTDLCCVVDPSRQCGNYYKGECYEGECIIAGTWQCGSVNDCHMQ